MKKAQTLIVWAAVFAFLGMIFAGIGFYKISVYENSEHSWVEKKNVYVGGDAYNYIINGTYFAGYSALSGAMFICACACALQSQKAESMEELLELQKEMNHALKVGYAEDIEKEKEKKEEYERVQAAQAEWERKEREAAREAEEAARLARIVAYWDSHPEEKKALADKRAAAEQKLKEAKLTAEQRKALEELIKAIDEEFEKDREG